MALELIWEPRGVVRKFSGVVTMEDLGRAIREVHDDARFDDLTYSINDFLDVTSVNISKAAVADTGLKTIRGSLRNRRVLVAIVTNNPSVTELADFYISPKYQPYPSKIFETISAARCWIDLETD